MPGNIVKINNYEPLSWYVGDSKMDELIKWLNKNGVRDKMTSGIGGESKCIDSIEREIEEDIYSLSDGEAIG